MSTTVVIVDDGNKEQEAYAHTLVSDPGRILRFSHTLGLLRLHEHGLELYGSAWYEQVSSKLDREYLRENWESPVEVIILASSPQLDSFVRHFNRIGFLSRPLQGKSPLEVQEWLRARL